MAEDTFSDDQLQSIAKRLADELVEKRRAQWVDPETHYRHHQWVKLRLENEKSRRDLVNKIILSACIWAIPLIIGWVAMNSWHAVIAAIRAAVQ